MISYESCCHRCGVVLLYFKPSPYGAQRQLNGGYWELDAMGAPVRRHFCERQYRADQTPLDFVPARAAVIVRKPSRERANAQPERSLVEELGL